RTRRNGRLLVVDAPPRAPSKGDVVLIQLNDSDALALAVVAIPSRLMDNLSLATDGTLVAYGPDPRIDEARARENRQAIDEAQSVLGTEGVVADATWDLDRASILFVMSGESANVDEISARLEEHF